MTNEGRLEEPGPMHGTEEQQQAHPTEMSFLSMGAIRDNGDRFISHCLIPLWTADGCRGCVKTEFILQHHLEHMSKFVFMKKMKRTKLQLDRIPREILEYGHITD